MYQFKERWSTFLNPQKMLKKDERLKGDKQKDTSINFVISN